MNLEQFLRIKKANDIFKKVEQATGLKQNGPVKTFTTGADGTIKAVTHNPVFSKYIAPVAVAGGVTALGVGMTLPFVSLIRRARKNGLSISDQLRADGEVVRKTGRPVPINWN